MNITHKKCKSQIYQKIPINLISPIGLTTQGIKIVQATISFPSKIEPQFFCPTCDEMVPLQDISGRCGKCFEEFNISDLYLSDSIGGIYCKKCETNLTTSLDKALSRIRL
jgi:hypothetical protein